MKKIFKTTIISINIATAIFCLVGVCFDIINGGKTQMQNFSFTKMVIGEIIIGIGFGVPTAIYENKNIPLTIQSLFHMGIGCITYTAVAFWVGWIPIKIGFFKCSLIFIGQIATAFIIWFFYLIYYKKMAKKMNICINKLNAQ